MKTLTCILWIVFGLGCDSKAKLNEVVPVSVVNTNLEKRVADLEKNIVILQQLIIKHEKGFNSVIKTLAQHQEFFKKVAIGIQDQQTLIQLLLDK